MKYRFELASRTTTSITVEQKHEKIITGLKRVPRPWGINDGTYPVPKFVDGIIAVFKLDKILGSSITGNIIYRYRNMLENHSMDDDIINIEFNPKKIDYNYLISDVFKMYIDFFEPYMAQIFNEEIIYQDFEYTQNKNFRKDFIRFYPVCYYDAKYCRDTLSMSLLELKMLIMKQVEKVELYKNGIIIIVSSDFLSIEDADRIDAKLKSLFNVTL